MHIPDGFLDTKTAIAAGALSAAGIGLALRHVKRYGTPRRVPMMGLAAAFVFTAQMLNFPVAAGTSGHLVGGVLTAVLLGPGAAVIVMSCVLIVQAFLFADGGVLALGANIFNMAIAGTVAGYGIYRAIFRMLRSERGRVVAVAFAAWCSTVIAAVCCAGELAWSDTVAWNSAFPAMANIHILLGVGEGLITSLIIAAIVKTRPELLIEKSAPTVPARYGGTVAYGILILLGLLLFVAPYASGWPDGLEHVAASLGFAHRATTPSIAPSPLQNYLFPGIGSMTGATAAAGAAGALVVFGLSFVLARILVPARDSKEKRQEVEDKR